MSHFPRLRPRRIRPQRAGATSRAVRQRQVGAGQGSAEVHPVQRSHQQRASDRRSLAVGPTGESRGVCNYEGISVIS